MKLLPLLMLPMLAAIACSTPVEEAPAELQFAAEAAAYDRGDTVRILLHNQSSFELGYNFCMGSLERIVGGSWVETRRWSGAGICPAIMLVLEPGGVAVARQPILDFMPPGTYRFRHSVAWPLSGGWVTITTRPFLIRGD